MRGYRGLCIGIVLAAASTTVGQEVIREERTTTIAPDGTTTEVRRVSQLIGSTVQLSGANEYGKVEDVVIGPDGCVDYLVVARENQFAMMPYAAAQVNFGRRAVIYDVTPQVVQPLFFAPDAWPNIADPTFGQRMQRAFGERAARREERRQERQERRQERELRRAVPPGAAVAPAPAPPGAAIEVDPSADVKVKETGKGVKVKIRDR